MNDFASKLKVFFDTVKNETWRQLLLDGLLNTVKIAILGLLIGIIIGTLIAVIQGAPKTNIAIRFFDKLGKVYVALFRGTPMVVQLLVAYYVLLPTILSPSAMRGVSAVTVGIVVFGMNSGAYVSEIMRSGINSVEIGQMEAGRALGLTYATTMIKVVVPQAIKNILPTLGNEFITLIKETSVLSFITVYDLYTVFKNIGNKNYEPTVPYLVMALVYILLVLLITLLVHCLEKLLAKSDRSTKRRKA